MSRISQKGTKEIVKMVELLKMIKILELHLVLLSSSIFHDQCHLQK